MSSPTISPGTFYQLTNNLTGANLGIDHTSGTSLLLKLDAGYSYWQFLPTWGQSPPKYHLCTQDCMSFWCLSIFASKDKNTPHLVPPGYDTGQFWSAQASKNDTVRLSNDYSGPTLFLNVQDKGPGVLMGEGDNVGQDWTLKAVSLQDGCAQPSLGPRGIRDIYEHGSLGRIGSPKNASETILSTQASKDTLTNVNSAVVIPILLGILLIQGIWLYILLARQKPPKVTFRLFQS